MPSSSLQNRVRDLKDHATESFESAKLKAIDGTREAVGRVDREAHRKPWTFVAWAAAFTGIFAFFLGRKSKKRDPR